MSQSPRWVRPVALVAAVFGLLTIFSGGTALFGNEAARAAVGNAVPFVLWFNFLAGFVYVLGALALFIRAPWAKPTAWFIGISTLLVFAILLVMAFSGTAFEWRTIGAMVLRSGFWVAIAIALTKGASTKAQPSTRP